jgi:hypothetical protein
MKVYILVLWTPVLMVSGTRLFGTEPQNHGAPSEMQNQKENKLHFSTFFCLMSEALNFPELIQENDPGETHTPSNPPTEISSSNINPPPPNTREPAVKFPFHATTSTCFERTRRWGERVPKLIAAEGLIAENIYDLRWARDKGGSCNGRRY